MSTFQVIGLAELVRGLRTLGGGLKSQLHKTDLDVAHFVAQDSAAAAYSIGGVAAHVAPSIKAAAGPMSAAISLGGPAFPMAGGAEFGANTEGQRSRSTGSYVGYRQFEPWRGHSGYFVYPTIRRDAARIEDEYGQAVDDLLQRANLI